MTKFDPAFMQSFVYWLRCAERSDIDRYLIEVAELGVRQVFVPGAGLRELEPDAAVSVAQVAQALAGTGVHVHTVHGLFDNSRNLGEVDQSRRAEAVRLHETSLGIAADLGADNLVLHLEKSCSEAVVIAARRSLDHLLPVAERLHVQIALETLPPKYYGGEVEHFVELLNTYASPWLGVCLDTGHAALARGPKPWIDALAPRIITVHLHDNDGRGDQHLPPGLGVIDWPETVQALHNAGYAGPLVSEARMPEGWGPTRMIEQFQLVCGHSRLTTSVRMEEGLRPGK